ncbi:MAG TPA: GH1 family beta-glucosidase [Streptosporangiaceae bacterium]|jgi:beta-glucosidase
MSVTSEARAAFPAGFLFGTATAAYQIEGSPAAGGRGPSIWDTFSHAPGNTWGGDTGDIACDHYRRYPEDLDLMAELGIGAYRFSVSWTRIQPDGKGPANTEGVDFYRRLVAGLRDRGIEPLATLYHWDLPQALQDAGGWPERDTAARFAEYAAVVARALGDEVSSWITLNEPWCSAWLGYGSGHHAPGIRSVGKAAAAHHHLLLGHGEAAAAVRAALPAARVGLSLNLQPIRPASDHPEDVAAMTRIDGNRNRIYLDPIFRGSYPSDMLDHYPDLRSAIRDGDLAAIAAPVDFLGINYYSPGTVADQGRTAEASAAGYCVPAAEPDVVSADLRVIGVDRPAFDATAMGSGWEIEPQALTELLMRVSEYTSVPVLITENGAAFNDYVGPDGAVHDADRIGYLDGHLRAVLDARAAGVDVAGYFVWSLLDNFEWGFGYAKRFGLIWVDYPTGTRLPKDSFRWYREVATRRELP